MRFKRFYVAVLVPAVQAGAHSNIDLTGKPDGTIQEPFTMVTGVRELPGDHAIVTDQFERAVYLVDFSRGTRRQLGRQGDGPAEYRFPMAPMPATGNRTWILDATLRRIHVIEADGKFGPSLTPPYGATPGGLLAAHGVDATGRIYFEGNSFNSETGRFLDSVAVIRWNPFTNLTETLGKVWSGGRVIVDRNGSRASVARLAMPFPHVDAWTPLADGQVAIVRQNPHQIVLLETGGVMIPGPLIPYTPIPVTTAEKVAWRERRSSARMVAAGGSQTGRAPPVSDAEFPGTMPPFIATSVTSAGGAIWVGQSFRVADRTRHYRLYDPQGRETGRATLLRESRVAGIGNDFIYVARTDPSDDLVYLERYRRR